jgi:hypothetical protein
LALSRNLLLTVLPFRTSKATPRHLP